MTTRGGTNITALVADLPNRETLLATLIVGLIAAALGFAIVLTEPGSSAETASAIGIAVGLLAAGLATSGLVAWARTLHMVRVEIVGLVSKLDLIEHQLLRRSEIFDDEAARFAEKVLVQARELRLAMVLLGSDREKSELDWVVDRLSALQSRSIT